MSTDVKLTDAQKRLLSQMVPGVWYGDFVADDVQGWPDGFNANTFRQILRRLQDMGVVEKRMRTYEHGEAFNVRVPTQAIIATEVARWRPKKAHRARMWNWGDALYSTKRAAPDDTAVPVAMIDVSDPKALIKRTAILMDIEDGTGAGFDYAAETILLGLGVITKRHVTKLPVKGGRK